MDNTNVVQFPKRPQLAALNAVGLPTSSLGDRGENVQQLQVALVTWGYDVGPSGADGIYGPDTAAAVKKLQAALHVDPTGNFDAATLQAVNTDLSMPHGVLPRSAMAPGAVSTPMPLIDQKPLPKGVWIALGLGGLAFLYVLLKGRGEPAAPASAPSPGVSGASDYLDLPDHPDEPMFDSEEDNRGYEGDEDPVDSIVQEQLQRRHAKTQGRYLMQKRRERDARRRKAAGLESVDDEEEAEIVEE